VEHFSLLVINTGFCTLIKLKNPQLVTLTRAGYAFENFFHKGEKKKKKENYSKQILAILFLELAKAQP